jgi:hypothetical protein
MKKFHDPFFLIENSYDRRNIYPKSVYIFIANATVITLRSNLSFTTCFGCFWPSSGRFHNNTHGKVYRGGGVLFTVNILKHVHF